MNRREMIACLAAGGMVTASGLWWPGKKLISIPKNHIVGGTPLTMWLTLRGKKVYQWTEMCRQLDNCYDAPDRVIHPANILRFDDVVVKSPLPIGPKEVKLGMHEGIVSVLPGNTLTLQWSPSGILTVN